MNLKIGLAKNVRKAMAKQDRDVSRVVGGLAGIVAVLVALSLPSVYFAIAYESADAALQAESAAVSRALDQIVNDNPEMWEFETVRIRGLLEQRFGHPEDDERRVLDREGNLVAEIVAHPAPPLLVLSHPIRDAGWPVGRLEIRRSLRPLLWRTAAFALLGGILGVAVFLVFRIFPLAALRKALGQLAREKERAQITLGAIAEGVVTTDGEGNVEIMNRPAERMTGWRRDEAAGRPIRDVYRVLDRDTGRELDDPLTERRADAAEAKLNVLVRRDGTRRLIHDSAAPIPDGRMGSAGAVLVFRDMTEKVQKDEELIKWQKLESIGNLAGGIAHEFNNFLAGILGNISLGKQALDPGSRAYARLEEAEKASSMASELAARLLTFSKGGSPVRELISLDGVIRDSAGLATRGTPVRCSIEIQEGLWAAYADAGQIGQAVSNLVLNAAQAIPGEGTVTIRADNITVGEGQIAYMTPGRYVRIDVADTGVGIPAENLKRVLDPYFTTREGGPGLGLTTAYHIMKSHGGNLFVESEPGKGTTVSLLLPATTERPSRAMEAERAGRAAPNGKWKVLVMDDEQLVLDMACGMLEHLGCEANGARDGGEAIRLYGEAVEGGKGFDLVVMDLTIPGGMGGTEASRRILGMYPEARLVVSSGYSADPVMANYVAYGFRGVLPKPYRVEELRRVLEQVLEKR
jgi:two-component system cell cycle sensor histidine kinase/response regulator CckA